MLLRHVDGIEETSSLSIRSSDIGVIAESLLFLPVTVNNNKQWQPRWSSENFLEVHVRLLCRGPRRRRSYTLACVDARAVIGPLRTEFSTFSDLNGCKAKKLFKSAR